MATNPRKDAEYGWLLYRDSGFTLSKGELDDLLAEAGLAPLSMRMFRHYRKLERYGHEGYLPINQLDVRTLSDPIWEKAARTSYPAYPIQREVSVALVDRESERVLDGVAVAISDGELSVRLRDLTTADEDFVHAFQRKRSRVSQVLFKDTGELRLTDLASVTTRTDPEMTVVRLSFSDPEAIDTVLHDRDALPRLALDLTIGLDGRRLMATTAQQLVAAFQLVEAARIVEAEILGDIDREGRWRVDPPEVRAMSSGSPLEIALYVSGGVGSAVTAALLWAKGYFEIHKSRLAAERSAVEVEIASHELDRTRSAARAGAAVAEQEELRTKLLRLELEQQTRTISQKTIGELEGTVVGAIATDVGEDFDVEDLDPSTRETTRNLLRRQVAPAAQRLVDHADGHVEVSSEGLASSDREGLQDPSGPRS